MEMKASSWRSELMEAARNLFLDWRKKGLEDDKCDNRLKLGVTPREGIVTENPMWENLSKKEVEVVLTALRVPLEKKTKPGCELELCGECRATFMKLIDRFLELEELQWKFEDLRRKVWREVILGSLEKCEGTWEFWEKNLWNFEGECSYCGSLRVEQGCVKERLEVSEVEEEEQTNDNLILESTIGSKEEDYKLTKMSPVVVLERMSEISVTQKVDKVIHCEAEIQPKMESDCLEFSEENSEVNDIPGEGETGGESELGTDCAVMEPNSLVNNESWNDIADFCQVKIEVGEDTFVPTDPTEVNQNQNVSPKKEFGVITTSIPQMCGKNSSVHVTSSPAEDVPLHIQNACGSSFIGTPSVRLSFRRFPCSQCNVTFLKKHLLSQHVFEIHGNEAAVGDDVVRQRRFQCPSCYKSYGRMSHLTRHIREKNSDFKFPCPSCPKIFGRDYWLLNHRKLVHGYVPCRQRKKKDGNISNVDFNGSLEVTQNNLEASQHQLEAASQQGFNEPKFSVLHNQNCDNFRNLLKPTGASNLVFYLSPFNKGTENVKTTLDVTPQYSDAFTQNQNTHFHIAADKQDPGNNANSMNICKLCGFWFTNPADLVHHLNSHQLQLPFQVTCGEKNMETVHQNFQRSSYKCPHCTGFFGQSGTLRMHLCQKRKQELPPGKPFVCRICFRAFPSDELFGEHLNNHALVKLQV